MLKLPQRLDDVDVLPRPRNDQLTPLMQTVIQHLEGLEHVAPVLALVVEALVQDVHDLVEGRRVAERHLRDLGHVGADGAPWVVGGSCAPSTLVILFLSW
jgi:hypothetical protein